MTDKRRGGSGPGGSSSHVLRTTTTAMANASSSTSAAAGSSSSGPSSSAANSNRNSIIAPPPRVALSGPAGQQQQDDGGNGGPNQQQQHKSGTATPNNSNNHSSGGSSINAQQKDYHHSSISSMLGGGSSGSNSSRESSQQQAAAAQAALNAAAAATQLVKEKDLRIAALERELNTMEVEFGRELDKLSQNESEAAAFWQSKHSLLNQQFLRADTELRLLRAEVELREAERDELRSGWEGMRRELEARESEVRELRGQVRGLKDWVSSSTRSAGMPATSDEVFADGLARLGNGLQNWVIVNFRRARIDPSRAPPDSLEELRELVPTCEDLAQTAKLHLLQSLVSRVLVEMVFDSYFVGLTEEQAVQFGQMESLLSSFASSMEPVNQWRSATLAIVNKEAPQRMQEETARLTEEVVARVSRLLDAITAGSVAGTADTTATTAAAAIGPTSNGGNSNSNSSGAAARAGTPSPPTTEARDNALRLLVSSAVELARLLVVQRASFDVFMPQVARVSSSSSPSPPPPHSHGHGHHQQDHPVLAFDPVRMEDMGGHDEESLRGAPVGCVIFPGVIKRGDESGGHLLQYENIIAKARVLCRPG